MGILVMQLQAIPDTQAYRAIPAYRDTLVSAPCRVIRGTAVRAFPGTVVIRDFRATQVIPGLAVTLLNQDTPGIQVKADIAHNRDTADIPASLGIRGIRDQESPDIADTLVFPVIQVKVAIVRHQVIQGIHLLRAIPGTPLCRDIQEYLGTRVMEVQDIQVMEDQVTPVTQEVASRVTVVILVAARLVIQATVVFQDTALFLATLDIALHRDTQESPDTVRSPGIVDTLRRLDTRDTPEGQVIPLCRDTQATRG